MSNKKEKEEENKEEGGEEDEEEDDMESWCSPQHQRWTLMNVQQFHRSSPCFSLQRTVKGAIPSLEELSL